MAVAARLLLVLSFDSIDNIDISFERNVKKSTKKKISHGWLERVLLIQPKFGKFFVVDHNIYFTLKLFDNIYYGERQLGGDLNKW
jgi:hypothetical protein